MKINHVEGKKSHDIVMYALSTCIWCKKTKALLAELGLDFSYVDVDLLDPEEKEEARKEVERWNPSGSYPTIVINNEICVRGYKPEEIKEKLGQ